MANTIQVAILAETAGIRRGVNESNTLLGRFDARARSAARSAKLLVGAFAGSRLIQATAGFLGEATKNASDLQQSTGGVDAVFGKSAAGIKKSAGEAAQSLGLSRNAYQELATVLGASLKNQGIKGFAKETKNVVGLGADLAAQYGGSTREAVEAIGSLMRGETDPIERYGISINETAVNAELAARGQTKLKGAALTQAKAQARLALLMRQSKDAHGAFAREMDTDAGIAARNAAAWENTKTRLGTALLPLQTLVRQVIGDTVLPLVERFVTFLEGKAPPAIAKIKAIVQGFKDNGTAAQLGTSLGRISTAFADMAPAVSGLASNLPSVPTLLDKMAGAAEFLSRHSGLLKAALVGLAGAFVIIKTAQAANAVVGRNSVIGFGLQLASTLALTLSNFALARSHQAVSTANGVQAVTQSRATIATIAQNVASKAAGIASKAWAAGQWLLNAALTANPIGLVIVAIAALVAGVILAYKHSATFRAIVQGAWSGIKIAAGATWNFLKGTVWPGIKLVFGGVITWAKLLLSGLKLAWNGAKAATAALYTSIRDRITFAKNVVTTAWNIIRTKTTEVFNGIRKTVSEKITAVRKTVSDLKAKIVGIFANAGNWLLSAGRKIIGGLIDGIKEKIGAVKTKLRELTGLIPDWKGPRDRDAKLLTKAGELIMQSLVRGFDAGEDRVRRQLADLTRLIAGAVNPTVQPTIGLAGTGTAGGAVVQHITLKVEVGPGVNPAEVGRVLNNYLSEYKRNGGKVVTG